MLQPSNSVELARQRDPKAIANLLNSRTMPLKTTTKISLKGDVLQLLLESSEEPDREKLLPIVQGFLVKLKIGGVERVRVYGRKHGEEVPEWTSEFEIVETQDPILTPVVPQKKVQSFKLAGALSGTPQQERIEKSKALAFSLSGAVVGLLICSPIIWSIFYGQMEFRPAYLLATLFIVAFCYISGFVQGSNLFDVQCPACSHAFEISGTGGECPACREKLFIDDRGNCQKSRSAG